MPGTRTSPASTTDILGRSKEPMTRLFLAVAALLFVILRFNTSLGSL